MYRKNYRITEAEENCLPFWRMGSTPLSTLTYLNSKQTENMASLS